jgi:catechol 2,3-dioxygenase-like lactoylglutathione lyase family enzyme
MAVRRIVADIAAEDPAAAHAFYVGVLGLEPVMDLGWIVTFAALGAAAAPQVSVARKGGAGTPVPDLSVEVDDLDAVLARARAAGFAPEYGPVAEPWGVRRAFLRDPFGKLVNVLQHA